MGLLSPSFQTELERQKTGDRTELATGFFDTSIAPLKRDRKTPNKKKGENKSEALPCGRRMHAKTSSPD
jgi:hypothetical protein